MRGRWLLPGLLIVSACFPGPARAQTPASPRLPKTPVRGPDVVVRIYNYAGAPADELAAAEAQAVRLLEEAGVATEWRICPDPTKAAELPVECKSTGLPREFWVNLLPRKMTKGIQVSPHTFGLTLHDPTGRTGQVSWVFYARVREAAKEGPATVPQLLGHAFAHELGHLLFGNTEHSPEGLMRACWGEKEIRLVAAGKLGFDAADSRHLRLALFQQKEAPAGEIAAVGLHSP